MTGTTPLYGLTYPEPGDRAASMPAQMQQLAEDVESTLAGFGGIPAPGSFQTPTLFAGEPTGGTLAPPRYRKVGVEVIHRGVITFATGLFAGSGIYYVPAGFRPLKDEVFHVGGDVRVDVRASDGAVIVQQNLSNGAFVSLSGIRYFID